MGLRARLSGTLEEKMGAVQDILGGERFTATKLDGGQGWKLQARVPSLSASVFVSVCNSQ
jgi:hypothetical protein